jgi:hypothetical protein
MGEEHRGTSFEHALLQCLRAQRSALHKGSYARFRKDLRSLQRLLPRSGFAKSASTYAGITERGPKAALVALAEALAGGRPA